MRRVVLWGGRRRDVQFGSAADREWQEWLQDTERLMSALARAVWR